MRISMRDFVASGSLGPARLGMSQEQVTAALGPPDATNSAARAARHPLIWSYGRVHLWFEEQPGTLKWIGADYFPDISYVDATLMGTIGVDASLVDHWILHGDLSLAEAEASLSLEPLGYSKSEEDAEDGVCLTFESGVRMAFSREWSRDLMLASCFIRI